jgi:hypothetical protein
MFEYEHIFKNLRQNEVGRFSVTRPYESRQIIGFVEMVLNSKGKTLSNSIVTDCTAGTGGDTIAFSYLAKHVNAIENAIDQYELLEDNCRIADRQNIKLIHDDCMNVIDKLYQDVIIIDPPWGGSGYKNYNNLQLSLSGYGIDFVANYAKRFGTVFIKLPLNADLTNIPIENKFLINNKKNIPSFYLVHISQGIPWNQENFSDIPIGWKCP